MMSDFDAAKVNGVTLNTPDLALGDEELRQRACTELLRQAAQHEGLLDADDAPSTDGVISEAAANAIEALLEREIVLPLPSDDACRRHFEAHKAKYAIGEKVRLRHILFAVTVGVDVVALRQRAEHAMLDVRCYKDTADDRFAQQARELSNCPSGANGGDLGWLQDRDCAPEFAREIFGRNEVGVLPRLVHSRFGLHVVEVLERVPGMEPDFEAVKGAVMMSLQQNAYVTALRQYIQVLAGEAHIEGVLIDGADTPLVQ